MPNAQTVLARTSLAAIVTLGLTAAAASPASASVKTYRGEATDPSGDGPAPGRDITDVKVRYKSDGSILFVITTAGPIDGVNADAGVGVSVGSTCNKLTLIGSGQFSAPNPVKFGKIKGKKILKPKTGKGEITNNVYTLEVKSSSFKNLKVGCFAVALVDPTTPATQAPVPFDQIDETKIK